MPPEQDDPRTPARRPAPLRVDLDVRRPDGPGPAGRAAAPVWPWLLVTFLLMAVSLAGGIAIGSRDQAGTGAAELAGTTASSAAARPPPPPSAPRRWSGPTRA